MHLLSITNIDYVLMTFLFGLIVAVSYSFRRKNPESIDYLLINGHHVNRLMRYFSCASIGLIEFMVLSSYGAYAGLPALCLFIPMFLLSVLIYDKLIYASGSFELMLLAKPSSIHSRFILGCYALFLLFSAGVAIAIMVTLLKSLLGWEFANSTLSMMGLIAICLLVGGVISVVYNQVLVAVTTTALLLAVLLLGYKEFGFGGTIDNLHAVALSNKFAKNYFTELSFANVKNYLWLFFLASGVFVLLNPLYFVKHQKEPRASLCIKSISRFWQLIVLSIMLLVGVFALATPNTQPQIDGQKIVTQQTRLADGSIGYIVKSINSDAPSQQRGIIPLQLDNNNQIASLDSSQNIFDFSSAGLVMIKHVLPYAFISLFIIALLFYKTLSEVISFITIIVIRGFYTPYYNKTKEDLENLWAARVFLFMFLVLAISVGLALYKFFDLYYMFGLLMILGLPILLNFIGVKVHWIANLLIYVLLLVILICNNISELPHILEVFKFSGLLELIKFSSLLSVCWYVIAFVCGKFLKFGVTNE